MPVSDSDIARSALLWIQQHGESATAKAREMVESMRRKGDAEGADTWLLFAQDRIKDISDYCETDVVNTYRLWLRYELFRGRLMPAQFAESEADLAMHIRDRLPAKPHLAGFVSDIEAKSS